MASSQCQNYIIRSKVMKTYGIRSNVERSSNAVPNKYLQKLNFFQFQGVMISAAIVDVDLLEKCSQSTLTSRKNYFQKTVKNFEDIIIFRFSKCCFFGTFGINCQNKVQSRYNECTMKVPTQHNCINAFGIFKSH